MSEPLLASTLNPPLGPQAYDLTILDHVKGYLFQAGAPSNVDDGLLQRLISSASVAIQAWLGYDVHSGKTLVQTTYTELIDAVTDGMGWATEWLYQIPVRYPPIQSVTSVTIDTQVIPAGGDATKTPGWFLDPDVPIIVYVAGYWPWYRAKKDVKVIYSGGYPAIPEDVEQACIETVALRYKRASRIDVRSASIAGETTVFLTGQIPDSAIQALWPYKRIQVN